MGMIMFYVTFPSKEEAQKVAHNLVDRKLVACSNVFPIASTFHWQGAKHNDDEWVAIMKTSHANTGLVEMEIEKLHSYEVPCILHWEFECNLAYEKWLRNNIQE